MLFTDFLQNWIQTYPQWLFAFTFTITALESFVLTGFFIPGLFIIFTTGTLITQGYLNLQEAFFACWIGSFLGETFSFFIGRFLNKPIKKIPFLTKRQDFLTNGENFFSQYGKISIFIGHFAGPFRSLLPFLAGTMKMPIKSFLFIAFLASFIWCPLYILPGYLLSFPSQWTHIFSDQSFFIFFTLFIFFITLITFYFRQNITVWNQQKTSRINIMVMSIFGSLFIILTMMNHAHLLDSINAMFIFSHTKYEEMVIIKKTAVVISCLGDKAIRFTWIAILFFAFWFSDNKKSAITFLMTLGLLGLTVILCKYSLDFLRPMNALGKTHHSFPSGHVASVCFLSFVTAHFISCKNKYHLKYFIWGTALFISILIAISRIYLHMHWFSDVLGAFLLAITFFHLWLYSNATHSIKPLHHPLSWSIVFFAMMSLLVSYNYPFMLERYYGI